MRRNKHFYLLTFMLCMMVVQSWGQLASWKNLTTNPSGSLAASSLGSNVASASIGRNNLGAGAGSSRYNSDSWNGGANDYLQITITASAGYVLNLNGQTFSAAMGSSNTGPSGYQLRSSVDNYVSVIGNLNTNCPNGHTANTVTLPSTNFNGLASITFRINGVQSACRSGSTFAATGTGGPNALSIGGSAVSSCAAPTTPPSGVALSSATSNSITLSWTNGDGTNRIVKVNTSNSFPTTLPTTVGTISGSYDGTGDDIVFDGTSNSATISGLASNTTYYFRVYDYNVCGVTNTYNTSGSASSFATQCGTPTVASATAAFTNNTASLTLTPGNGSGRIVKVNTVNSFGTYAYNAALPTAISSYTSGEQILYVGTGSTASITGLTPGTQYFYKVYEYNVCTPPSSARSYNNASTPVSFTTCTTPTTQSSIIVGNPQSNSLTVAQLSQGNGTNRIIKINTTNSFTAPVDGSTAPTGVNPVYGGSGEQIVFNGTTSGVTVTNLQPGTQYFFRIYDYNNCSGAYYMYNTSGTAVSGTTCFPTPATPASDITFATVTTASMNVSWTNGSGTNRVVKMNTTNSFTDPTDYASTLPISTVYGSGEQYIYNGTGNNVTVTSLLPGNTYYFRVYEYNPGGSCSSGDVYNLDVATGNPTFETTCNVAPTSQASNILASNISAKTMDLAWTNGDGANRVVVINTTNSFTTPSSAPTANPAYSGFGEQVVYDGNGSNVTVTNLVENTTYWYRIYEYNTDACTGGSYLYLSAAGTNNPSIAITVFPSFRTVQPGDWNNVATWETSDDNLDWTTPTAAPDFNSGSITIQSNHDVTVTSDLTIDETTIFSNGSLIINPDVTLTLNDGSGADLNVAVDGNLIFRSTAAGSGRLADLGTATLVQNNNVTVERHIGAKTTRKNYFVASPVDALISGSWQQQIHITGAGTGGTICPALTPHVNGFDATVSNNSSFFTYDNTSSASKWIALPGTNNTSLTPGVGYRVTIRGDRNIANDGCALLDGSTPDQSAVTLSATGNVKTGDVSVTLDGVTTPPAPGVFGSTLVGNPYPSEIDFDNTDWEDFRLNNNLQNAYVTYLPCNTAGTGSENTYTVYTTGSAINNDCGGFANPNVIASGQSFFIRNEGATTTVADFFRESYKTTTLQTGAFKTTAAWDNIIRVALKTPNDTARIDECLVRFSANGSVTYNRKWDATAISSSSVSLASLKENGRFGIQTRPENFVNDTVQLSLKAGTGNYLLQFSEHEDFAAANIYLVDRFANTVENVRANHFYSFNVTADSNSKGDNRFELVFAKSNPTSVAAIANKGAMTIYPNPVSNELNVLMTQQSNGNNTYHVSVINAVGQEVFKNDMQVQGSLLKVNTTSLTPGVYYIQVQDAKGFKAVEKFTK